MAAGTLPAVLGGATKNTLVVYDGAGNVAAAIGLVNSSGIEIGTAGSRLMVSDDGSAAFQGAVVIAPGNSVAATRSLGFICTTAGNITLTLADNSSITLPITLNSGLFQTLPFAVTKIVLGSGTAGTFWGLK